MAMSEFIKRMREKMSISQEVVAKHLGYTRQTYTQIENGKRDISLGESRKLAQLFNIPFDKFVMEQEQREYQIEIENNLVQEAKVEYRISVPQNRVDKFKEILLYILAKVGAKPNIGETVLYKILYFIDFDYYEKFEEQLMGAHYIKNLYGPTPIAFKNITDDMIKNEELERIEKSYYDHNQKKYLPRRLANLDLLTAREIKHIDNELERLSDMNATELSEFSHKDVPWITAKDGEEIEYEGVFYRTKDTSVRVYD